MRIRLSPGVDRAVRAYVKVDNLFDDTSLPPRMAGARSHGARRGQRWLVRGLLFSPRIA